LLPPPFSEDFVFFSLGVTVAVVAINQDLRSMH